MELRAEGISRRFLRKSGSSNIFMALEETDFVLPGGKLTEVTGRSGSGKSTLLNILAGLLVPTTGKVYLGTEDLYAMPDEARSVLRNRHIGIIPQGQTALHSLTVLENVLLPRRMYPKPNGPENAVEVLSPAEEETRARTLLEKVGISHLAEVWPNELSGGEMRRLAIARALMMRPEVILADEPTGDLDDENTRSVLELLRDCADAGAAVLLVTHETEARDYADKVFVMGQGKLTEALHAV